MLKAICRIPNFDHNQLGVNESLLLEEACPLNPTTFSFLASKLPPIDLFFFPTAEVLAVFKLFETLTIFFEGLAGAVDFTDFAIVGFFPDVRIDEDTALVLFF